MPKLKNPLKVRHKKVQRKRLENRHPHKVFYILFKKRPGTAFSATPTHPHLKITHPQKRPGWAKSVLSR